jgi:MerR family redox-sensitive transcriptional activator SoxR
LPQPQRESGRRRYGEEAVLQIALIQLARQAGFTLSEIHDLYGDFRDPQQMGIGFQRMAPGKLAELDELIRAAEGMKALLEEGLRAECVTLEECAIVSRVIEGFRG